jgi:hypothetical protein
MKFVVKNQSRDVYLKNLFDANETVNWRDVILVRYDMVSSTDVQCPICMEQLKDMVCPRITKCGHVYCWPCMLQYLDYQKEKSWKRCPLCFDAVYKLDLKHVEIRKNVYYKDGDTIKFDLIVRSRANTITKNKKLAGENLTLLCNSFPEANDENEDPYRNNKIRLNTRTFYKRVL